MRKTGFVLLGAALTVAGTAAYLYFSENARHRLEGAINREKAKHFVRSRLNGSDVLIKAVDNLSDSEVNSLVRLADSAGNAAHKASDTFSTLVDVAKDNAHAAAEKVSDFFN